ncbi:MAG: type II and III secretion system protein family protein [Phycisphaeraceae bacterium]
MMNSTTAIAGMLGCATLLFSPATGLAQEETEPSPPTSAPVIVHGGEDDLERVEIFQGRSRAIQAPWPVQRVAVTDEEIADVVVLSPRQVMLLGRQVGATDVILWGEDEEQVWQARVRVVSDLDDLRAELEDMFEGSDLKLREIGGTVIVSGMLRRAEHGANLADLLDARGLPFTDMTTLAGVQQVQIEVRVAEASRNAIRALGVNLFHASDDFVGGLIPDGSPLASGEIAPDFLESINVSPGVSLFAGIPAADMQVFIRALAENQYIRMLAEPNLVAMSGEEASFLAGGEFPIPVVQGGAADGTAISIEYREFGVRLAFRPTVLGDGTIHLHVAPEVSELTDVGAVTIQGFQVPALVTRRAETTVELKSGQSFAMAGLLQDSVSARNAGIPGLRDVPVLGALFRSVRYERGETELVVLVTAKLVEPLSDVARRPVPDVQHQEPTSWELFVDGRIETDRPSPLASVDAQWMRAQGLHRLQGPGAWANFEQARVPLRRPRPKRRDRDGQ